MFPRLLNRHANKIVILLGEGARIVKTCLSIITSHDASYLNSSLSDNDEFAVVEKIKKHLKTIGYDQDTVDFDALHRKLVTVVSIYFIGNITLFLQKINTFLPLLYRLLT